MTIGSEELESFGERITKLYSDLDPGAGHARVDQVEKLADAARDWFKLAAALKEESEGFLTAVHQYEEAMTSVLKATKVRTRASAFRRHLEPFKTSFMDDIVVPLMKHEGSPSQAAARQVESLFTGLLGPDEQAYVSEAARCSAVKCYRAAIVMLWAAAVARLHGDIQRVGFIAYNQAAADSVKKTGQPFNRITKSINITNLADLQLGRDFDLIAVGIELWKYDLQTFEELNRCLNTRNSAAHPGSFEPTSVDVHQFAEKLRRHLFAVVGVSTRAT